MTAPCDATGVKVEFKMLKLGFAVVFYRPKNKVVDKTVDKVGDKTKKREQMILEYLAEHEFITSQIVCDLLNIASTTAKRVLKDMVDNGLLLAIGERKTRRYVLK